MTCPSLRSPLFPALCQALLLNRKTNRTGIWIIQCRSSTDGSSSLHRAGNGTRGTTALYPYPAHPNPTPHQIFHLPNNASQDAIKSRYYELVKIYHPDSSLASASGAHTTAEARFQAITTAYNALRKGKTRVNAARSVHDDAQMSPWRKRELRNRAELKVGGLDERWKERLMIGVLFLSVIVLAYQTFDTRKQALAATLERGRSRQRGQQFDDAASVTPPAAIKRRRSEATIRDEESLALSDAGSRSS